MVADNPQDHARLFLHPTENQLWANSNHDTVPKFPKYIPVMFPVCDQKQYESLIETLSQVFKNLSHNDEEESQYGSCLAKLFCIASLGICFCPFLYWSCKKNKEKPDDKQFEAEVSATVDKYTAHWSGKVSIRRETISAYGELISLK